MPNTGCRGGGGGAPARTGRCTNTTNGLVEPQLD